MALCLSLRRNLILCISLLSLVSVYLVIHHSLEKANVKETLRLRQPNDDVVARQVRVSPVKNRDIQQFQQPERLINRDVHIYRQNIETATCKPLYNRSLSSWNRGVVTVVNPPIEKNCEKLRRGDKQEFTSVKSTLDRWTRLETNKLSPQNCSSVREDFLHNFYVSKEELEIPLAFSLIVSSRLFQVIRLLKSIYRPHNVYCIHPDGKMGKEFSNYFRMLELCLDNVFVPKKIYKVYYAHHSIMDAELSCMEELLEHYPPPRWKYSINICGTELPLKTNREMVRSVKSLNGACAVNVYTTVTSGYFYNERLKWELALNVTSERVYHTDVQLSPAPHGLKIYKGDHFVMLTPEFIKFVLSDTRALDLRKWLQKVYAPEEEFFATLYMLSGAPGGGRRRYSVPKVDEYIWMFPGE